MAQGAFRPRSAKVSKFPTALDLTTGELVPLSILKALFFAAANSNNPKVELKTLREKFKLACPHCKKARLVFSFGSQNPDGSINPIAGSSIPGNPAHLKTKGARVKKGETTKGENIHAPHCTAIVMNREGHEIDADKGYRIHLNLKQIPERNPRNKQLVMREPGGKIVILDTDLKDREPWSITKASNILQLMRSGQTERLGRSVIIHGDRKTPWSEFMLPATYTGKENSNIAQFAKSYFAEPDQNHPLLENFDFRNCTVSNYRDANGKAKHYKFPKTAPIEIPGIGSIVIQPELRIENEHLFTLIDSIHRNFGEIFVLDAKPFIYKRDSKTNIYMMVLVLRDPDMMVKASLDDIMAISKKRHDSAHSSKHQASGLLSQPQP